MWALDIRAARPSVIAAVGAPDGVLVTPCQLAEAAWAELNRGPEERFTEITVPTEFPERRKRRSLLTWSLTLTTGATIPMFGALAPARGQPDAGGLDIAMGRLLSGDRSAHG